MSFFVSYLPRLWRRRPTVISLAAVLLVFLICVYTRTAARGDPETVYAQRLVGAHKKLQQADTEPFQAVQFIPGVPGSGNGAAKKRLKAPPNHSGFNVAEEARIHKGLYENRPRLVKDQVEAVAKAKEQQRRLESQGQGLRLGSNSHQGGPMQPVYQQVREQNPPMGGQGESDLEYGDMGGGLQAPAAGLQNRAPVYYPQDNQPAIRLDSNDLGHYQESPTEAPAPYVPQHRLVHLDLKGAPPTINYLKKVLSMSLDLGATGVLLEYEDMFPWSGRLAVAAATNHYTKAEVEDLLDHCKTIGLEVIPLVQTFGHLEFVLKHKEFAYLRDVAEMPESVCPCHNDTMAVVRDIVDQVMALHRGAAMLHNGCDEVFHLGECAECAGRNRNEIFVEHVTAVARYVRQVHQRIPIVWDDMLRNLLQTELGELATAGVEPMVWWYGEDIYRFIPTYTWDRYEEAFNTSWGASAFKGAHGPTLVVPPIRRHLDNNLAWTELMANEDPKFKQGFQGIVVTGWQRYDHFGVLAELLPSGIPSMAVDLVAVRDGFFNASNQKDVFKALECVGNAGGSSEVPFDYDSDPFLFDRMSWCYFPGNGVYKVARSLIATQREVGEFVKKVKRDKAWMTDFNVERNYSSPFRVEELMEDWALTHSAVVQLARSAKEALLEVFDIYTVAEWIEQKVLPMYKELARIKAEADALKKRRTWPARPFDVNPELAALGIISSSAGTYAAKYENPKKRHLAAASSKQPIVSELSRHAQAPQPVYYSSQNNNNNNNVRSSDSWQQLTNHGSVIQVNGRTKRLVQAQDNYRHPQGYR